MPNLTAFQRQQALREVASLANDLGMPEAVYVGEHGVTIVANPICAARWVKDRTAVRAGDVMAPLTVTEVEPIEVSA